ncbi:MAG: type II secretion system F family protein [Thermomicrobiales bacterium]
MDFLLPICVFGLVLAGVLYVVRRSNQTVARLSRHEIASSGGFAAVAPRPRTTILADVRQSGVAGKLAARISPDDLRSKSAKLLLHAGDPMSLGTYLLVRAAFLFLLTPYGLYYVHQHMGLSSTGIIFSIIVLVVFPNLPPLYIKRKARKREREIERAMPDSLDLLVVCVEGGLSLDGALQQVGTRSKGLLASEIRRLQAEITSGMARRDALLLLASRSSSQSLGALCSTINQSEKMGVSISTTLRMLSETLRTQRRQGAETAARKAPIKMLPFIVFFMLPALFIVILGPVAIGMLQMFRSAGS